MTEADAETIRAILGRAHVAEVLRVVAKAYQRQTEVLYGARPNMAVLSVAEEASFGAELLRNAIRVIASVECLPPEDE